MKDERISTLVENTRGNLQPEEVEPLHVFIRKGPDEVTGLYSRNNRRFRPTFAYEQMTQGIVASLLTKKIRGCMLVTGSGYDRWAGFYGFMGGVQVAQISSFERFPVPLWSLQHQAR